MVMPYWPEYQFKLIPRDNTSGNRAIWWFRTWWLKLWNAVTREAILTALKDIILTVWWLTSPPVSRDVSQRKLGEKSLTIAQRVPNRTTNWCMSSGVLSTIEKGYQYLKFMWMTWLSIPSSSSLTITLPKTQCAEQFDVNYSLWNRWQFQQHLYWGNSLMECSERTCHPKSGPRPRISRRS